jgi:tetratricopeptide (TPR) repeat protein
MKKTVLIITALFAFANIFAQNCNLNEAAKRHIGRARAYISVVENDEDYLAVFNEYKNAYEYAPNCPDICYDVAYYADRMFKLDPNYYCNIAMEFYRKYLRNALQLTSVPLQLDKDVIFVFLFTL